MRRRTIVGLAVAGLAAAVGASRALGSRPDEPGYTGPLPLCPGSGNCYRARTTLGADADAAREAAVEALRAHDDWLTGRPVRVTPTELGATAVFKAGPFRDDVALAVVDEGGQTTLHVRSASRVGESDLGLNRLRARRIVAEVERRVGSGA